MTTRDIAGRPLKPVPDDWPGSEPEYRINQALLRTGRKAGIDFIYQNKFFGGRISRGGVIIDFVVQSPRVGINVQSEFFHLRTSKQRAADRIAREATELSGLRLEFIDENDARDRPDEALAEALAGTRARGPLGV